jgi:ATP-dependent DNA helicase DinG
MASRIEEALAHDAILVAESGTGTGKTFAYLVPALLSGRKTLISTGTRHLQDQLFRRDLPVVLDALAVPVTVALLKGRANYLCLHRLERLAAEGAGQRLAGQLARVREWSSRTRSGDIGELGDLPEDAEVWPFVTSTAENCLGGKCESYEQCHVLKARREALAADVVVINHHLFFADLALREEGFGSLLPGAGAVIFDEAHQLPEIASLFFSQSFASAQLRGLVRDVRLEEVRERSGVAELIPAGDRLDKAVSDFRLALGEEARRAAWTTVAESAVVREALAALERALRELGAWLEKAAPRGEGLAGCARRASTLLDRLLQFTQTPGDKLVAWFEATPRGFGLHLTPLDTATPFRARLEEEPRAWVFTSATLSVNGRFDHFQAQLGLETADTAIWESPFDYAGQSLLYLPSGLPEPSAPDYPARVVDLAVEVIAASRGRAFLLFTSHRALRQAAERIAGRLDYPLLVQGQAPRGELLARFRELGNAVLLGTGSFWEGVDVRGESLSCVIIDKLPFATPDDPVFQARAAALEEAGGNPFVDFQIPAAVLALKQGAGRLIRDTGDRGVLVLCDPRLLSKGYGRSFLRSLPPMRPTRDLDEVRSFFQPEAAGTAVSGT